MNRIKIAQKGIKTGSNLHWRQFQATANFRNIGEKNVARLVAKGAFDNGDFIKITAIMRRELKSE